jgi:hypothetical protein
LDRSNLKQQFELHQLVLKAFSCVVVAVLLGDLVKERLRIYKVGILALFKKAAPHIMSNV